MEMLLRLYRAEDTGLKTVIPSLRETNNVINKIINNLSCNFHRAEVWIFKYINNYLLASVS